MKRINIKINDVVIWSAYKSNSEYQSWIDYCVAANLWGAPGTYVVEVLDADAELELRRQSQELATKQVVNSLDSRVVDLETSGLPTTHINNLNNPHNTTKAQVGLSDVDNVSAINLRDRSTHTGNESQLTWNENISPSIPVQGLTTYSRDVGGRNMFSQLGKAGVYYSFQPHVARNRIYLFSANGNATTSTVIGGVAPTTSGTATTRTLTTANRFTWFRRVGYVSSATNNSVCGIRNIALQYGIGNLTGVGGFHFIARFGISDATLAPNARLFVGMTSSTTALGNADPSTFLNIIGVGMDAADTTLQIIHNDGAGAATKVNLGASFPESTNTDMYELVLFCAPNGIEISYQVTNLSTGVEVRGDILTNIPLNTQLLTWQLWRHNVNTGVAVGLDVVSVYMETDN